MSYQQKIIVVTVFTVCFINSVICDNIEQSDDVMGMWIFNEIDEKLFVWLINWK